MPREAIVAASVWVVWYAVGWAGLSRKYRVSIPHSVAIWESGLAVLAVSLLCGASVVARKSGVPMVPVWLVLGMLAVVPAVTYWFWFPKGPLRHIASTFHLTMHLALLASVPWVLGIVPSESGMLILCSGGSILWLGWGLGLGLWQRCRAHVRGALALLTMVAGQLTELPLDPLAVVVIVVAGWFARYEPKPLSGADSTG